MIRIMLADSHPVVRYGLVRWLRATTTFNVVAMAATANELMHHVQRISCDVVIGDTLLGKRYDLLPVIKKQWPSVKIIIFSRHGEASHIREAFRAGATGYVGKAAPLNELVVALQDVMSGKRYVDRKMRNTIFDEFGNLAIEGRRALSPRQSEVLEMIADGKRSIEIAELLGVSIKTVSSHRTNLLDKMKLSSTQQMVRHVVEQRLLTLSPVS